MTESTPYAGDFITSADPRIPRQQYINYLLGSFRVEVRKYSQGVHIRSYYCSNPSSYTFRDFSDLVFSEYCKLSLDNEVINIVFKYMNSLNHYIHLSIRRRDIEDYGVERVLTKMLYGDPDVALYHGSDYVDSLASEEHEYQMSRSYFAIVYKPMTGGLASDVCSFIYCECVDVALNRYDCFFDCVVFVKNHLSSFDSIGFRLSLGIPLDCGIHVKHIPSYEQASGVTVCVVDDDVVIKDIDGHVEITPRVVYGSLGADIILLLKDGHYYIFWKLKEANEILSYIKDTEDPPEVLAHPDKHFSFFDYETVYDSNTGHAIPYCVSCTSFSDVPESRISITTNPLSDQRFIDEKTSMMFSAPPHQRSSNLLVGYNNSGFDNLILMKSVTRNNHHLRNVMIDRSNRVLYLEVDGHKVIDLYRFLLTPLSKACASFSCNSRKLPFDHNFIQELMFKGERELSEGIDRKFLEIEEYSRGDVCSLAELFFRAREEFRKLLGVFMEDYCTISSMSYKCFKSSLPKTIVLPIVTLEIDTLVRRAVIGGRTQMFKGPCECDDAEILDFVSLYPYVMMNREYPLGTEDPMLTKVYVPGFIGVYDVVIHEQPEPVVIPKRNRDGDLVWDHKEPIECWITSVDYECLIRHKSKVFVRRGILWRYKSSGVFTEFMGRIIKEKKVQDEYKRSKDQRYNKCYRECVKLVLNSLSGKMIERVWKRKKMFVRSHGDVKRAERSIEIDAYTPLQETMDYLVIEGEVKTPKIKSPSIIGVLIYSYAREFVYETLITKSETKFATDTDSIFLERSEAMSMRAKYPYLFGTNEGQLVGEFEDQARAMFISPKCYIYYRELRGDLDVGYEILKPRWKGVKKEDKVIQDQKLVDLIREGRVNMEILHSLYSRGDLKDAVSVETYIDMVKNPNKDVYILSNRIERSIKHSGGSLSITNTYVIKRYTPSKDLTVIL